MTENISWWSPAFASGGLGLAIVSMALLATPAKVQAADACTLLSSEEIAEIVGERVRKPRSQSADEGATACLGPMIQRSAGTPLSPV